MAGECYNDYTFDGLFGSLVKDIYEDPEYVCKPRGQLVKEVTAATVVLYDARARLLANSGRKADYGFAVGEFFWYWLGKQDLESMLYYNRRMSNFSDDGFTLNSAYGHRTRVQNFAGGSPGGMRTQWEATKMELLRDPDSRRAVLMIGQPNDFVSAAFDARQSKDVPCTLSLQFFIRDLGHGPRLRLHTSMRSNDAVWGLTYDLFSFTLLQECMMLELRAAGMGDLEIGDYTHTAGSLHIYEHHFPMASEVVKWYLDDSSIWAAPMEPIDLEGLALLAGDEEALRTRKVEQIDEDRYSGGVRWLAQQLNLHRRKRDAERGKA